MDEQGKSQMVRLLDVVLFGPFMLRSAQGLPDYYRLGLTLVGWGTILYNGYNLLKIARDEMTAGDLNALPGTVLTPPGLRQLRRYNVNLTYRAPGPRHAPRLTPGRHPRRVRPMRPGVW